MTKSVVGTEDFDGQQQPRICPNPDCHAPTGGRLTCGRSLCSAYLNALMRRR